MVGCSYSFLSVGGLVCICRGCYCAGARQFCVSRQCFGRLIAKRARTTATSTLLCSLPLHALQAATAVVSIHAVRLRQLCCMSVCAPAFPIGKAGGVGASVVVPLSPAERLCRVQGMLASSLFWCCSSLCTSLLHVFCCAWQPLVGHFEAAVISRL